MILRLFLFVGLLLLGGTAYFVVGQQPPTFQSPPAHSELTKLQNEGILPVGPLAEDEELEHGIFDVPARDEVELEAAMANMDMSGMDMSGMDMGTSAEGTDMAGMDMGTGEGAMDMDMDGDGVMDMSSADMGGDGTAMDMGTPAEGTDMAGMDMGTSEGAMDMDMDGDGVMDMSSADMAGNMDAGMADTMEMAEMSDEEREVLERGMRAGLVISEDGDFDRELTLSMTEWSFSDLELEAQPGERIKVTMTNDGQIPHEFMFMEMAAMQAVNYRARRADWNLLEHEALYEKSLVLPGEEFTFVLDVQRAGGWMFMCMLPYHMQMGMMGQLSTPGMAMDMGAM